MQMKPRAREHAIMPNSSYLQLEFCFDFFWGKRSPTRGFQPRVESSAHAEAIQNRICMSLCLWQPFLHQAYKELTPRTPKWESRITDLAMTLEGDKISWELTERLSPQLYWPKGPNSDSAVDFTSFSIRGYLWTYLHCSSWKYLHALPDDHSFLSHEVSIEEMMPVYATQDSCAYSCEVEFISLAIVVLPVLVYENRILNKLYVVPLPSYLRTEVLTMSWLFLRKY